MKHLLTFTALLLVPLASLHAADGRDTSAGSSVLVEQGEMVTYHWKKLNEEHPAITDRHVTFANMLARKFRPEWHCQQLLV